MTSRICCYVVDGDPWYLRMAEVSIRGVRRYNERIPIRVFLIDDTRHPQPDRFLNFCARYGVQIAWRDNLADGYFQNNKAHVADGVEERLLVLDSDTFVFGDVASLFDEYEDLDVIACRNEWAWRRGYREEILPDVHHILNSGVILCSREFVSRWSAEMAALHRDLRDGTTYPALSEWLHRVHDGAYNREEFGFSICAGRLGMKVGEFRDDLCRLSRRGDFGSDFQPPLIFHSFSYLWDRYYALLRDRLSSSEAPAKIRRHVVEQH